MVNQRIRLGSMFDERNRVASIQELRASLAVDSHGAARLLNRSVNTIRELVKCGELKAFKPGGGANGKLMFRVASLEAWLAARETEYGGNADED